MKIHEYNKLIEKYSKWKLEALFTVEDVSPNKKYNFRCSVCGYEFNSSIDNIRTRKNKCINCKDLRNIEKLANKTYENFKFRGFTYTKIDEENFILKCDKCNTDIDHSIYKKINYSCKNCKLIKMKEEKRKIVEKLQKDNINNVDIFVEMKKMENKPVLCGIYKLTSPTGKIYIGQSKDI